jgi:VanZ family protein
MTDIPKHDSRRALPAWLVFAAPFAVMAAIFFLSSRPHLPNLDGGRDIQGIAGHFFAYAALGASLAVLLRWLGWGPMGALFAAVVLATLYGVTDELHQSFVPNRMTDPKDVLVDFLGATAGALLAMRFMDWREEPSSASSDAGPDRPADESS